IFSSTFCFYAHSTFCFYLCLDFQHQDILFLGEPHTQFWALIVFLGAHTHTQFCFWAHTHHKEVLHTEVEHMEEGRMELEVGHMKTVDIDINDRDKGMCVDPLVCLHLCFLLILQFYASFTNPISTPAVEKFVLFLL
ncbi:hypothetical protein ACJX0J_014510, partial [Zea mays]